MLGVDRFESALFTLRRIAAALIAACIWACAGVMVPAFAGELLADAILIKKAERKLTLLNHGVAIKSYKIALGTDPDGPKSAQGDGRTPEGKYVIDYRNRDSGYHLALHISYPNKQDKERARRQGASPGGDIMIHGIKNGFGWIGALHTMKDWTKGCIAVTDREIEEISSAVADGTPVEIRR